MSIQISIGIFSKITRLSRKALRIYDAKELITAEKDNFTGYRYYKLEQIQIGIKIKLLVSMGFGLNEINEILQAAEDLDESFLDNVFSAKLSDIQDEIVRLKQLEEIIKNNNPMDLIYMRCSTPEIKHVTKTRVFAKREKGTYGITIGKMIGQLTNEINKNKAQISGPIMTIYHDDDYKEEDADIEVLIPVTGRIAIESDYEIKYLEEVDVASVIHTGPYEEIGNAHARCIEYVVEQGFETIGKTRELYLNDPNMVSKNELLTEIQIPVKIQR